MFCIQNRTHRVTNASLVTTQVRKLSLEVSSVRAERRLVWSVKIGQMLSKSAKDVVHGPAILETPAPCRLFDSFALLPAEVV